MSEALDQAIKRYVEACNAVNAQESIETAAEIVAAWRALKAAGRAAFGKAANTVVFTLVRSRYGVEGVNALATAFRRPSVRALIMIASNKSDPSGTVDFDGAGGAQERQDGFPVPTR